MMFGLAAFRSVRPARPCLTRSPLRCFSTSQNVDTRPHTVLVDGSHLVYRAFFAHRESNRDFDEYPAIAAFGKQVWHLHRILQPHHNFVVLFDPPRQQSNRRQIFAEYKATRKETPKELVQLFDIAKHALEALSVAHLTKTPYEADDLIASYAMQSMLSGHLVTITSVDKDMMQLLRTCSVSGGEVRLLDPRTVKKTLTTSSALKFNGPDYFERSFPTFEDASLFASYQALIGDPADNIPRLFTAKQAIDAINLLGDLNQYFDDELKGNLSVNDQLEEKKIQYEEELSEKQATQKLMKKEKASAEELAPLKAEIKALNSKIKILTTMLDKLDVVERNLKLTTLEENLNVPLLDTFAQSHNPQETELAAFSEKYRIPSLMNQWNIYNRPVGDEDFEPEIISDEEFMQLKPSGVTIVRDSATAKRVVAQLMKLTDRYHACDTETTEVDFSKSPIGQATKVICLSIYVGEDIDFGTGPILWVDTYDECAHVLQEFKEYFESPDIRKVWHNCAFDKHVLYNAGIKMKGYGGDTMLMSRLWNASRTVEGGYSLQAMLNAFKIDADIGGKRTIKERFGYHKIKQDGSFAKAVTVPPLEVLQRHTKFLTEWIEYSAFDAKSLYLLREALEDALTRKKWISPERWTSPYVLAGQSVEEKQPYDMYETMWEFYENEWLPLGEVLTEIEQEGIHVDVAHLKKMEKQAYLDNESCREVFSNWIQDYLGPDGRYFNIDSDAQKQQFLFMPCRNQLDRTEMPAERIFKTRIEEGYIPAGETRPRKVLEFKVKGVGMRATKYAASGLPSVANNVLKELAGDPTTREWGTAYKHFKGLKYRELKDSYAGKKAPTQILRDLWTQEAHAAGVRACKALSALVEAGIIQTLLSTFLVPLQHLVGSFTDEDPSRIHTQLNINTETGRLSSKGPNLQNQPALEKDRYRIRAAFTAKPGCQLIVADYGQLELRLLAHITRCKSMLDAFASGGDFHSRTAYGMYDVIQNSVKNEEVVLEKDKNHPPHLAKLPAVKDVYASERRKAKVLNFSIAYGKTKHGLAKDWNVSVEEAEETLNRWYADRPEVREWQRKTEDRATHTGETYTLLGRARPLFGINSGNKNAALRAAINTPLQGGAADIVNRAMILLYHHERLNKIGWKQVLQIHDEIILEGPTESAEEALAIVKHVMSNPLPFPLLVKLEVDANIAPDWFTGK